MKRKITEDKLRRLISKLSKTRVLVVGDIILDHYIWGSATRLSPEAPVPIVWANKEDFLLGGASNVAFNLACLGSDTFLSGMIGKDFYGDMISSIVKEKSIDKTAVVVSKARPTTLKARVIAKHQQVVRIDWESTAELPLEISKKIVKAIKNNVDEFDALIIEDYGKGVINPYLIEKVVNFCKENNKIVTVDPKEDHFNLYKNVTALTPNLQEAESSSNIKVKTDGELNLLGRVMMDTYEPQALLVTLGDKGMRLFLKEGGIFHLPTYAKEVFDVSGAGDTVIAVFTAAQAAGATFLEAACLSNVAASIVVERIGAAAVSQKDLIKRIKDNFKVFSVERVG